MPAKSKKQRKLMGLALHHPEKVRGKNKGVLKMSKSQLSDFASTKEKGLPMSKKKKKRSESISDFIKRRNKPRA
jgi:hypothetical protein